MESTQETPNETEITRITCWIDSASEFCERDLGEMTLWFTRNRYAVIILPAEESDTRIKIVGIPPTLF